MIKFVKKKKERKRKNTILFFFFNDLLFVFLFVLFAFLLFFFFFFFLVLVLFLIFRQIIDVVDVFVFAFVIRLSAFDITDQRDFGVALSDERNLGARRERDVASKLRNVFGEVRENALGVVGFGFDDNRGIILVAGVQSDLSVEKKIDAHKQTKKYMSIE